MLAFRILTTLLMRNGLLVKGKQFKNDRRIGSVLQTVNVFQNREIDEMIIVDIDASKEERLIDYKFIDEITNNCFMPLGFGGGIKSLDDVKNVLDHGADKVIIGSYFSEKLINEIAKKLGSQSITIAVDYSGDNVYINSGSVLHVHGVIDYAKKCETSGAGEIILTNIEREGTLQGCDFSLIEKVCNKVNIPVVVSGGTKDWQDFYNAYNVGASGVSAGALYQFTQITPRQIKKELREKGISVR